MTMPIEMEFRYLALVTLLSHSAPVSHIRTDHPIPMYNTSCQVCYRFTYSFRLCKSALSHTEIVIEFLGFLFQSVERLHRIIMQSHKKNTHSFMLVYSKFVYEIGN